MLGCGQSESFDKNTTEYISRQCANSIADLIDNLNLKNVIIYGNCIGGVIGMLLCRYHPHKLSAFIWADGYLYVDRECLPFVIPFIRYPLYNFIFKTRLGLNLTNFFVKYSTGIDNDFYSRQKSTSTSLTLSYIKDMYKMTRQNVIKIVDDINTLSFFIVGKHTMEIIKRSQKYWNEHSLNSLTGSVTGGRHFTGVEHPTELNDKVKKFLLSRKLLISHID